ncbi:MAG: hypothetical protein GY696_01185, partial [Gammaproteobacteria bacterium]|nr:hypothetical protein [Gammaproteobacteria bacterium]
MARVSLVETTFDYTEEETRPLPEITVARDKGIGTIPVDSTVEKKPGKEETVELPVLLSYSEYPESKPFGVTAGKSDISAALLTIFLIRDFWPQGRVRWTFTIACGSYVNETPLSVGMTDSIFETTHFKSCFLSLNEAPYVVRCARDSVSETCSVPLCVSEVLEHAVHMIPCPDVSDHVSEPEDLVECMFVPPSFLIFLPCRVLCDAKFRISFDSA